MMKRIVPWIVPVAFLGYLAAAAIAPEFGRDGFRIAGFGRIPVVMNGRVQPIDSVARAALLQIRGTGTVPIERTGPWRPWNLRPALGRSEWLLELLTRPDTADTRRIFPVREPGLIAALQLGGTAGRGPIYYTFADLRPHLDKLATEANRITRAAPATRASWEAECLTLRDAVTLYDRLKSTLQPNGALQAEARGKAVTYPFAALVAQYMRDQKTQGLALAVRDQKPDLPDIGTVQRIDAFARPFLTVSRAALFAMVPPAASKGGRDQWSSVGDSVSLSVRTRDLSPAVRMLAIMSSAYAQRNAKAFNDAITLYERWMAQQNRTLQLARTRDEFFYTTFQPFAKALILYLVSAALLGIAWASGSRMLRRSAARLAVVACTVHLGGLVLSGMLQGRLPVTNGYGRIVLLGWIAVVVAGFLGWRHGKGAGSMAAAAAGMLTLGVAQAMAPGGFGEFVRSAPTMSLLLAVGVAAIVAALATRQSAGKAKPPARAVRLAAA